MNVIEYSFNINYMLVKYVQLQGEEVIFRIGYVIQDKNPLFSASRMFQQVGGDNINLFSKYSFIWFNDEFGRNQSFSILEQPKNMPGFCLFNSIIDFN